MDFRGRTGPEGHPLGPLGLPRYGIDLVRGCARARRCELGAGYRWGAVLFVPPPLSTVTTRAAGQAATG